MATSSRRLAWLLQSDTASASSPLAISHPPPSAFSPPSHPRSTPSARSMAPSRLLPGPLPAKSVGFNSPRAE